MLSRQITLIIKVTNACDMHCRYCFIEPSVFHKQMANGTAQRVVRIFLDSEHFDYVHFVWHGGEPLLRGRAFFEDILKQQCAEPTRVRYANSVQTNATRLTNEMLDFLLRSGFHIGLSLDGPRAVNDATRLTRRHEMRSPHAIVVDAAERLRARGYRPGAIVVVNRTNVDQPEAIYHEFKANGINIQLNPLARSGLAAVPGTDLGITAEEYGGFLVRIFDIWFDDPNPSIAVDPPRQHIARILGVRGAQHSCHFTRSCHHGFLGIAPDGELYPCGMFQGEPAFKYGNIHAMAPHEVAATALFGKLEKREAKVLEDCAKCAFVDLCYSGCMFHSLKNAGHFDEKDYYCAGYKMYFAHVLKRVHEDMKRSAALPGKGRMNPVEAKVAHQ